MKRHLLAATAVLALVASGSFAQAATMKAEQFVAGAASGGMFEVESSKTALTKASDPKVKEFAEKMIADHGKANEKLMATAKGQSVPVPAKMAEKDAKTEAMLEKEAAGAAFDPKYVEAQVKAHDEAVALFTEYSESGDNAPLKAFAAETLPTLKEHQMMIHDMAKM